MKRNLVFLIALVIILLDQLTKYIARKYFSFTTNTGAAFGILQQYTAGLIVVSIIITVALVYCIKKYQYMELGFLLGGTIGNLIDRVMLGYVIDFINVGWWPSFNIADSFNTIGAAVLILRWLKKD